MHSRTGPFSLVTDTAVSRTLALLIEDEPAIAETVVYALEAAGLDAPRRVAETWRGCVLLRTAEDDRAGARGGLPASFGNS